MSSKLGRTPKHVNLQSNNSIPLQVYCRIRPPQNPYDDMCISVVSDTTIQLTPPDGSSQRYFNNKEVQYVFKKIFNTESTQKEVYTEVANPLVKNLIMGKNGLLLTYGVTGSGKTYAMNGSNSDGGIVSKCIDVLFNSIGNFQPKKYTFRPDKLNGFEVQSDTETDKGFIQNRKEKLDSEIEIRVRETMKINNIDEDNVYSVFISYIEIYNNSVFDLLEVIPEGKSIVQLNNRVIREDSDKNMYVHGVNELEICSADEALQLFYKGQNRKRMAKTQCNKESSRSHSVFTIRLVQAPLDLQGENVLQDKRAMIVSQLSLVDLAGSERTSRTQVISGQRLREAGNINNSLMTLRTCLETLRENQLYNTNKIPPYRDSKLTHLFKTYFNGDGDVRMIVCVNPRAEDYDENLAVMKFSEITQEVQVSKFLPPRLDFGLTPGRRKFNEISKKLKETLNSDRENILRSPAIDSRIIYNFGPPFPRFDITEPDDSNQFKDLLIFLETRRKKELELIADVTNKGHKTRSMIENMESSLNSVTHDRNELKTKFESASKKTIAQDTLITTLQMQMESIHRSKELLEKELIDKNKLVEKFKMMKEKSEEKVKYNKQKINQKLQNKLKQQAENYEHMLRHNQKQVINNVKNILESQIPSDSCSESSASSVPIRTWVTPSTTTGMSSTRNTLKENIINEHTIKSIGTNTSKKQIDLISVGVNVDFVDDHNKRNLIVSNPRHRRSRSAGSSRDWLHHHPIQAVDMGTLFQPTGWKKRKSVNTLTEVKDIIDSKTAKYSLLTQNQNSDGEIETHLFKADVLPTVGGGAQVVFNDVETLRQHSPTQFPVKKRVAAINGKSCEEIQNRCNVDLEIQPGISKK